MFKVFKKNLLEGEEELSIEEHNMPSVAWIDESDTQDDRGNTGNDMGQNKIIKVNSNMSLVFINSFNIGSYLITPVAEPSGQPAYGTVDGYAKKYDFVAGTTNGNTGLSYVGGYGEEIKQPNGRSYSPKRYTGEYSGIYGIPDVDFEKASQGRIKNRWVERGYMNYINWSLFEKRNRGWGTGQPTSGFIKDGVSYGAKPNMNYKSRPHAGIVGGKNIIGERDMFYDNNGNPLSNVKISAAGLQTVIKNNANIGPDADKRHPASQYPFIGRARLNTGQEIFFVGANMSAISMKSTAETILNYFKGIRARVLFCALGDGGGSATLVVDGKTIKGGNRAVPVIIYW